ncbi:hypothetical protein [Streptomyces sp. NPDC003015]
MATDKSTSDHEFASWTYDTLRIGLPASSTRYLQGTTGGSTVAHHRLHQPGQADRHPDHAVDV